ncbi:Tripartite motif-containing protein 59, partial [Acanthisitta chloris]
MDCLEEELTCAICYSIFVDPRVLTCSHTFCRNCLKGLIEQLDNFSLWRRLKCPSCRTLVEIPAAGAESLPINFALKAVIEKWQQEGPSGVPTCPEHHKQPLNIYCLLDRKLVCGQCLTIGQHHGHPIDDLQSAYLKAKETCGKLQEELRDRHWKHVFLRYMLLKERKCQCQTAVLGEKEVVVQYFKKLSDTLELKKQALLTALDELNSHIMEEYEPLIEQVQNMKLEQIKLYSLSLALLKEESPLAFLEGLERLQQRLQALRQKELPAVKSLEIYPRMRNVLEDLWAKTKISQISDIFTPTL